MSSFWTASHLQAVTAGQWLKPPGRPGSIDQPLAGVSTDTRTLSPGQVFVALKGDRFDGHDYLTAAAHAGAAMLLVDQADKAPTDTAGAAVLRVQDTLAALQALAADYRDALGRAGVRVIAVGGSNGKTTTRHLIHTALLATLKGTQSPRSFNNHIGVPLTLLAASEADDFVVVEVGTNHPGEIDRLGAIVRPHAAVITSLGHEHLAFLHDLAGVAAEEAALLRHVQPGGVALLPGEPSQQALLTPHLAQVPADVETIWFGSQSRQGQTVRAMDLSADGSTFIDSAGLHVSLPLLGRHNIDNALAAIAIARWMGVPDQAIAAALGHSRGVSMRLETLRLGDAGQGVTLLNDAYNANPDSMRAALEVLARLKPVGQGRRVAILGDMLELGDQSPQTHRDLGRFIAELDAAGPPGKSPAGKPVLGQVILIGKLAMFAASELGRHWQDDGRLDVLPAWDDDAPQRLAARVQPGDVVLLKASRGMAFERLIDPIRRRFEARPDTPADQPNPTVHQP